MSFDDIPEDKRESFPCQICAGGDIVLIDGVWQCDLCGFIPEES